MGSTARLTAQLDTRIVARREVRVANLEHSFVDEWDQSHRFDCICFRVPAAIVGYLPGPLARSAAQTAMASSTAGSSSTTTPAATRLGGF